MTLLDRILRRFHLADLPQVTSSEEHDEAESRLRQLQAQQRENEARARRLERQRDLMARRRPHPREGG